MVEYLCPFCRTTQTEIAQVENGVIFTYRIVPIRYHHLVHLLYVLERAIAKTDNVRMIEVRIRCEERMFCIKLEIHFLLCFILSMPHLEHGESLLINRVCKPGPYRPSLPTRWKACSTLC